MVNITDGPASDKLQPTSTETNSDISPSDPSKLSRKRRTSTVTNTLATNSAADARKARPTKPFSPLAVLDDEEMKSKTEHDSQRKRSHRKSTLVESSQDIQSVGTSARQRLRKKLADNVSPPKLIEADSSNSETIVLSSLEETPSKVSLESSSMTPIRSRCKKSLAIVLPPALTASTPVSKNIPRTSGRKRIRKRSAQSAGKQILVDQSVEPGSPTSSQSDQSLHQRAISPPLPLDSCLDTTSWDRDTFDEVQKQAESQLSSIILSPLKSQNFSKSFNVS